MSRPSSLWRTKALQFAESLPGVHVFCGWRSQPWKHLLGVWCTGCRCDPAIYVCVPQGAPCQGNSVLAAQQAFQSCRFPSTWLLHCVGADIVFRAQGGLAASTWACVVSPAARPVRAAELLAAGLAIAVARLFPQCHGLYMALVRFGMFAGVCPCTLSTHQVRVPEGMPSHPSRICWLLLFLP